MEKNVGALFDNIGKAAKTWFRIEELVLLIFLVLGVLIARSAGAGLDLARPFRTYGVYLIKYTGYTFIIIKPLSLANERWSLSSKSVLVPLPDRQTHSKIPMLKTEVELVRGGLLMTATLAVYTNIKTRLPILADRLYDSAFLAADRLLLGDHFHETIVGFVSSSRAITGILDLAYANTNLILVICLGVLWLHSETRKIRVLLLSYCFSYILGIIISVEFPSYGLFFFEPENYEFLEQFNSERYQWGLKRDFEANRRLYESDGIVRTIPFSGITAFPSLHVAHMTIVTMVGWRHHRYLGLAFLAFSILGTIATVALGWHYAVDGIAGCALGVFTTESLFRWVGREQRE